MKKRILLNIFPPAGITGAAGGISILKAFLEKEGYAVDVKYWNMPFEPLFKQLRNYLPDLRDDVYDKQTCILAYQALKADNKQQIDKAIDFFIDRGPQLHAKGRVHMYMLLQRFSLQVDLLLEREFAKIDFTQYMYVGSAMTLYQWVYSNVITGKIKAMYPDMPCVIGGIGTPKAAEAFLRNSTVYDYAIWGEGEYPLLELTQYIEKGEGAPDNIASLAYRDGDTLHVNAKRKKYLDLNSGLIPDYSDFFNQLEEYHLQDSTEELKLYAEIGRGCHWKQCKFCFLNSGYNFRTKDVTHIMAELRTQLKKYPDAAVYFTDNDIVGNDPENFSHLLDEFIRYKATENPNFRIYLAEVISKSCNFEIIKKMRAAGFYRVQVGYESPSDELLRKMHKSTSFSYNLFFLKWGSIFSIQVAGLNIIRNLLEETDQDIEEAIENLLFLRFVLNEGLHHTHGVLAINESSRYYKELTPEIRRTEYKRLEVWDSLPDDYVAEEDKDIILSLRREHTNPLWDTFKKLEQYYLRNKCAYALAAINGEIHYNETEENHGDIRVRQYLIFKEDALDWQLLKMCNKKVCSKAEMAEAFPQYKGRLTDTLKDLKKEGLIYCNSDQSEIVTVINTDAVE